jgi:hypothetical protein
MEFKNKREVTATYRKVAKELQQLLDKYGEDSNEGQIINFLLEVELQDQYNYSLEEFDE